MCSRTGSLLGVLAALLIAGPAVAAPSSPSCVLRLNAQGNIEDELTGLKANSPGPWFWYIATLTGPGGEKDDYFRPGNTTEVKIFFPDGPGEYVGRLWTTVDNMKGPAKFTRLPTECSLTL